VARRHVLVGLLRQTPAEFIEAARAVLGGFDLDPASSQRAQQTVRAERYYTIEEDGLAHEWRGRVWLNPPYKQPDINLFMKKMLEEVANERVSEAIMLTNSSTDKEWFHLGFSLSSAICFTRGRIKFVDPHGERAAPTQGQAFFYFGRDARRFCEVFRNIGFVVRIRLETATKDADGTSGLLDADAAVALIVESATRVGLPRVKAERTAHSGIRTTGALSHG
jgi:phage N-6-adenine-methyltransferase